MSHRERRVRVGILSSLIVLLSSWMVLTAMAQRPREDIVSPATQLLITQVSNANAVAISDLRGDLKEVRQTANNAAIEIKEMRQAVWGMAATILISLLLQVAQIRKGRTSG